MSQSLPLITHHSSLITHFITGGGVLTNAGGARTHLMMAFLGASTRRLEGEGAGRCCSAVTKSV